ncbi:hypothetical protein [Flagellimonas algicola]|uniref:DKNYY family protein n=1 Tax=Flagellimonas algicola TaxID=2583815 RepID=A0ABY2WQT5_9FLAO|nr:hypothetical protein [Allomuricauda algicola]TMU57012.1 hypothetical protein FGG15_05545 [Allomuricauda algicola]
MKKTRSIPLTCIVFLFYFGWALGQTSVQEKDHYNWFDKTTGIENTNLLEGTLTVEKYGSVDGTHKFYTSNDYLNGHIVFDGETYFDVDMKYDLYEDELLLPLRSDTQVRLVKLIKERISEFVIDGHRFIPVVHQGDGQAKVTSFYEVLSETALFTLLKKHKKVGFSNYKKNLVRYKFVSKDTYYINHGGDFTEIKNKKDILRIFPEAKSSFNKRSFDHLKKTNRDEYFLNMMEVIHQHWVSNKRAVVE